MNADARRLEGGKFFLDLAKFVLSGVAVTSFITERVNLKIGLVGLIVGALLAVVGIEILPPKEREATKERGT